MMRQIRHQIRGAYWNSRKVFIDMVNKSWTTWMNWSIQSNSHVCGIDKIWRTKYLSFRLILLTIDNILVCINYVLFLASKGWFGNSPKVTCYMMDWVPDEKLHDDQHTTTIKSIELMDLKQSCCTVFGRKDSSDSKLFLRNYF